MIKTLQSFLMTKRDTQYLANVKGIKTYAVHVVT